MNNATFTPRYVFNELQKITFNSTITENLQYDIDNSNFVQSATNYLIFVVNTFAKQFKMDATKFASENDIKNAVTKTMNLYNPFVATIFPGEEI